MKCLALLALLGGLAQAQTTADPTRVNQSFEGSTGVFFNTGEGAVAAGNPWMQAARDSSLSPLGAAVTTTAHCTWPVPFPDTSVTVIVDLFDSDATDGNGARVDHIKLSGTTGVDVVIVNDDAGVAHNAILWCLGLHD